jgi:hypothetical protein
MKIFLRVYEEDTTMTTMTIEVTPPAKYAWFLFSALNFAEVHREVASAYVELGTYYAKLLMK